MIRSSYLILFKRRNNKVNLYSWLIGISFFVILFDYYAHFVYIKAINIRNIDIWSEENIGYLILFNLFPIIKLVVTSYIFSHKKVNHCDTLMAYVQNILLTRVFVLVKIIKNYLKTRNLIIGEKYHVIMI